MKVIDKSTTHYFLKVFNHPAHLCNKCQSKMILDVYYIAHNQADYKCPVCGNVLYSDYLRPEIQEKELDKIGVLQDILNLSKQEAELLYNKHTGEL